MHVHACVLYVHTCVCTVEPLITDTPRSGQPLYNGQTMVWIEFSIALILN